MSIVKRLGGSRGAKVRTLLRFAKYIAEKNDDFVHFALDLGLSPSSTSRTNRFLFLQYRLKFQPSCCRFCANPGVQPYPLPEKLPDFCRELCQLLCRTWAITHEKFRSPTSGRFSPPAVYLPKWTRLSRQEDAWCSIGGSLLMPADISKTKKVRLLIGSLTFLYYILCLLRIFRRRNPFRREDHIRLCLCPCFCLRPCLCHRSDRNANMRKAGRNCAPFRFVCRYGSLH